MASPLHVDDIRLLQNTSLTDHVTRSNFFRKSYQDKFYAHINAYCRNLPKTVYNHTAKITNYAQCLENMIFLTDTLVTHVYTHVYNPDTTLYRGYSYPIETLFGDTKTEQTFTIKEHAFSSFTTQETTAQYFAKLKSKTQRGFIIEFKAKDLNLNFDLKCYNVEYEENINNEFEWEKEVLLQRNLTFTVKLRNGTKENDDNNIIPVYIVTSVSVTPPEKLETCATTIYHEYLYYEQTGFFKKDQELLSDDESSDFSDLDDEEGGGGQGGGGGSSMITNDLLKSKHRIRIYSKYLADQSKKSIIDLYTMPKCVGEIGGNGPKDGKMNSTVFLKYIKQIKGKLHPSLRIKRTKLHLINDAILMTTLNKLLLGGRKTPRKLSYRIIHARTSKILRKKILSIIESNFKKLERYKYDISLDQKNNETRPYLFRIISRFLRDNKIHLDKKSTVFITILVEQLVHLTFKLSSNKGLIVNQSIEDIKSRLFDFKKKELKNTVCV